MKSYRFAVIGAGPAGIATVGQLLDAGIPSDEIAWIDSHFAVGDFGMLWRNVPSNTRVSLFMRFLLA
jgi:cation diffusion facilitator CzcD-associated flavoprotein CzcO